MYSDFILIEREMLVILDTIGKSWTVEPLPNITLSKYNVTWFLPDPDFKSTAHDFSSTMFRHYTLINLDEKITLRGWFLPNLKKQPRFIWIPVKAFFPESFQKKYECKIHKKYRHNINNSIHYIVYTHICWYFYKQHTAATTKKSIKAYNKKSELHKLYIN